MGTRKKCISKQTIPEERRYPRKGVQSISNAWRTLIAEGRIIQDRTA